MNFFNLSDLFSRVLFSFLRLRWPPLFLPSSRHLFTLFAPSKSALFCRAKGTAQSLERGSFRMDLSKDFGKEIPSRNLRKKGQLWALMEKVSRIFFQEMLRQNPPKCYAKLSCVCVCVCVCVTLCVFALCVAKTCALRPGFAAGGGAATSHTRDQKPGQ